MPQNEDDADRKGHKGFADDLPHLARRRLLVTGLAMGGAALSLWAAGGRAQSLQATGPDGLVCVRLPAGTAGPFPADGTNVRAGQTVNILTEAGVIREDIRTSIGGLQPVADGVPVTLEISLVDVGRDCAPLAGHAVYVWQCDAASVYSIYGAADRNYLRGVGISDDGGRVKFTTVFPGCYPGRWPHFHFEVFASADAALAGGAAILTSQFALPEAACREVFAADPRYPGSLLALDRLSLRRDGVFRTSSDAELAAQTLAVDGDARAGYRAMGRVGLLA